MQISIKRGEGGGEGGDEDGVERLAEMTLKRRGDFFSQLVGEKRASETHSPNQSPNQVRLSLKDAKLAMISVRQSNM